METSRREFLSLTAGSALTLAFADRLMPWPEKKRSSPRRVLVLGGTGFIGPHLVRALLAQGHTVTIFNRGRTNADLFPNVEKLLGDRDGDLESLKGHTWDVAIDNSATNPKWVRLSAQLLQRAVGLYLFTSTRSVYSDFSVVGMNEDGPTHAPDPAAIEEGRQLPYGTAKITCEYELKQAFPARHLVVRPGLIVGPGDATDRFTYWPARIDRGGEVLAPGDPDNHVHFIDVRDLAEWYVHLVETDATGTLNALGPASPLTFAEMLYGIRAVTTAAVSFTWVDTDFLLERDVRPYSDMPLWMPARANRAGFQRFDLTRPLAHGIRYRPLAVTARDTLEYHYSRPEERQAELRAGMDSEREAKLLAEWHATR